MGFKPMKTNFTFADISLFASMEKNRAIKRMEQINATVDWSRIESLFMRKYPVGKSFEGNNAYPSLLLLKCFLIAVQYPRSKLPAKRSDIVSFQESDVLILPSSSVNELRARSRSVTAWLRLAICPSRSATACLRLAIFCPSLLTK